MWNKILAFLFIMIMAVPLIPYRGNDGNIAVQQMVEDIQETANNMVEEKIKHFTAYLIHYTYPGIDDEFALRLVSSFLNFDERLHKCYHFQVLVQPPNC